MQWIEAGSLEKYLKQMIHSLNQVMFHGGHATLKNSLLTFTHRPFVPKSQFHVTPVFYYLHIF